MQFQNDPINDVIKDDKASSFASSHSDEKADAYQQNVTFDPVNSQDHPLLSIPTAFEIYCHRSRLIYLTFHIAREYKKPLKAISVHYKKFGCNALVELFDSPETKTSLLGSGLNRKRVIELTLPDGRMIEAKKTEDKTYAFTCPINGVDQTFEWKKARNIPLDTWNGGWQLMYGNEVVAAHMVELCKMKDSGRFMYMNTGATDEFGREWAILAVLSGLCLGQKKRDLYNGNLAAIA